MIMSSIKVLDTFLRCKEYNHTLCHYHVKGEKECIPPPHTHTHPSHPLTPHPLTFSSSLLEWNSVKHLDSWDAVSLSVNWYSLLVQAEIRAWMKVLLEPQMKVLKVPPRQNLIPFWTCLHYRSKFLLTRYIQNGACVSDTNICNMLTKCTSMKLKLKIRTVIALHATFTHPTSHCCMPCGVIIIFHLQG